MQQGRFDDEAEAGAVVDFDADGQRAKPLGIAGGVAPDRLVDVQRQAGRLREQFQVVERRQPAFLDDGGAAALEADGDAGAAQAGAGVADGGAVGAVIDPHDAAVEFFLGHTGEQRFQHRLVVQLADSLHQRAAIGRPDRDDDLVGGGANFGRTDLGQIGQRIPHLCVDKVARRFLLGNALKRVPGFPLEAIAGAGAGVVIAVVDGADHLEIVGEDRRGLQIVPRHPLAAHLEQIGGHLLEAAAVQGAYHIGQIGCTLQEAVGCGQVGHHVALRHVFAAVGEGGGLYFFVSNWGEIELGIDRLQRLRGLAAGGDGIGLAYRADAAVDLHIALDDGPVIEIFGVEVAAAEHVVLFGDGAVAGADEIGAGDHLQHQFGRLAQVRVGGEGVVAGGAFQPQHRSQQVFGQYAAHSAGQRFRQGDAGDGAVLHALAAGAFRDEKAAGLEIEHRTLLGVAHQRLGAGAGGEAYLDAAAGVGGGQKGF